MARALGALGARRRRRQRRHRRHRRPDRRRRRDRRSPRRSRAPRRPASPPEHYLDDNNTYAFFDRLGDLIRTGPDRHQRRRPAGHSRRVTDATHDDLLALMRDACTIPPPRASSLQLCGFRATSAPRFKRSSRRSSPPASCSRFAATASACPRRWISSSAGCRPTPPASASSCPSTRSTASGRTSTSPRRT